MGSAVEAEGLTKRYGKRPGVLDLTFEVHPREVFGFLGPNGAGKTTTIRTMLDFLRPTGGAIRIFGLDSHRDGVAIRRRTGYLPGELHFEARATGAQALSFLANLRGGVPETRLRELADRLGADLDARIGTLSHGNRQKLGLIQAFAHRPELIVLDEPTIGLDPIAQHEVHRMIQEATAEGATIFLSSHILPEVQELCDRVGFIRGGKLVDVEEVASLKARAIRRLEIRFAAPVPAERFAGLPGVQAARADGVVIRLDVTGSVDAAIKAAAEHTVENIVSEEPSLEEIFFGFYGGDDAGHHPEQDPA